MAKEISCFECQEKSCAAQVLKKNELRILDKYCSQGKIKKGETVFYQDAITSNIIYIRKGLVKEFMKGACNKETIFKIIKDHTYIGIQSILGDTNINHYGYSAFTDLNVCYIDSRAFKFLIKHNGNFAYEILKTVCKDNLNSRYKLMAQSQKNIYGKLADALLYMANEIFDNMSFECPFNRTELANFIGASRETTTRALQKLKNDGIIDIDAKKIKILKYNELVELSKKG